MSSYIDNFEDRGVDWRIILKLISNKCDRAMNWIDLAQDWDRWRDFVYMVMKQRVPENKGNFLTR